MSMKLVGAFLYGDLFPRSRGVASQICRQPGKCHLFGKLLHWDGFTECTVQRLFFSSVQAPLSDCFRVSPEREARSCV